LPLVSEGAFIASQHSPEGCRLVLLGAPLDATVSFRPGSRFAPAHIRQISESLEEYSPTLAADLGDIPFYDAGNINFAFGNVPAALATIHRVVKSQVLDRGCRPLLLGGEHLVTLPAVAAVKARYPELVVVQFDAHADLRSHYLGEEQSHATVMRRVCELVGAGNLYQFGIRSGTREEFIFGQENTHFFPYEVLMPLKQVLPQLVGRPVYVTVDIDVVDPAYAPGTGTPEPGGCSARELLLAIDMLANLNIVGFDLVEVCPPADHSDITAALAAKVVRQALLGMGRMAS